VILITHTKEEEFRLNKVMIKISHVCIGIILHKSKEVNGAEYNSSSVHFLSGVRLHCCYVTGSHQWGEGRLQGP
jgi:hypothetical protein